jgi:hypothetical protein
MPTPAKRPKDEFAVAMLVLFMLPLLPLILEFLLTIGFKSSSLRYLDRTSVMVTAPMFAVGVGMASRFKGVFGFGLLVAGCLAVMYGAQAVQAKATEADAKAASPQQEAKRVSPENDGVAAAVREDQAQRPRPAFLDRIGMDDVPGKIAWYGMIFMALALIVERAIRHLRFEEPYEFEWNK